MKTNLQAMFSYGLFQKYTLVLSDKQIFTYINSGYTLKDLLGAMNDRDG